MKIEEEDMKIAVWAAILAVLIVLLAGMIYMYYIIHPIEMINKLDKANSRILKVEEKQDQTYSGLISLWKDVGNLTVVNQTKCEN